ncbi:MAG: phosphatidate cytidylyltransferase [Bacilli bacterium]|nr:phosphatidate cytidylyltransferase [Bacilli bacterium]
MKQRIISAIIALIIIAPIFFIGGIVYKAFIMAISIFALKELIDIKNSKKEIPLVIKIIAYLSLAFLNLPFLETYKMIILMLLTLLIPVVFYEKKYDIEDAFFLIGSNIILTFFMGLAYIVRINNLYLMIFLLLIPSLTDIFAYFSGMLFGKHKLCPKISPKKTWEGSIGGTLIATTVATLFHYYFIGGNIINIVIVTMFLSVLGQFGDLFFSAIKRLYNKKDFSNTMPGHGGILDRIDSLIFVLIGYMLFI